MNNCTRQKVEKCLFALDDDIYSSVVVLNNKYAATYQQSKHSTFEKGEKVELINMFDKTIKKTTFVAAKSSIHGVLILRILHGEFENFPTKTTALCYGDEYKMVGIKGEKTIIADGVVVDQRFGYFVGKNYRFSGKDCEDYDGFGVYDCSGRMLGICVKRMKFENDPKKDGSYIKIVNVSTINGIHEVWPFPSEPIRLMGSI